MTKPKVKKSKIKQKQKQQQKQTVIINIGKEIKQKTRKSVTRRGRPKPLNQYYGTPQTSITYYNTHNVYADLMHQQSRQQKQLSAAYNENFLNSFMRAVQSPRDLNEPVVAKMPDLGATPSEENSANQDPEKGSPDGGPLDDISASNQRPGTAAPSRPDFFYPAYQPSSVNEHSPNDPVPRNAEVVVYTKRRKTKKIYDKIDGHLEKHDGVYPTAAQVVGYGKTLDFQALNISNSELLAGLKNHKKRAKKSLTLTDSVTPPKGNIDTPVKNPKADLSTPMSEIPENSD